MTEIIVDVDNNADVKITVTGVKGRQCTDMTADLEKALGKVSETRPTGEMYERESKVLRRVNR